MLMINKFYKRFSQHYFGILLLLIHVKVNCDEYVTILNEMDAEIIFDV